MISIWESFWCRSANGHETNQLGSPSVNNLEDAELQPVREVVIGFGNIVPLLDSLVSSVTWVVMTHQECRVCLFVFTSLIKRISDH